MSVNNNHLFFSVLNKRTLKHKKMLLGNASQIRTVAPSGKKEDFMCLYEREIFTARIAENSTFIYVIKQQYTVSLSYHLASHLHKITLSGSKVGCCVLSK